MSVPRQISSNSSSPSKSSLRQVSIHSNPTPRNPTLLPSPHFNDSPIATSPDPQESTSYDDPIIDSSSLPPNFQPFFTLIEDPITHEHYHPTVHYIFADDEADIITEASIRSLEDSWSESQAIASASTKEEGGTRYLPPPQPGVKEHYLILDVQSTSSFPPGDVSSQGYAVTHSTSLSSDWQVLRTNITQAPTIGDSPEDEGLMLRIEGRGNTPTDNVAVTQQENQSLEGMIDRFQRRLEDVKLVMEGVGSKNEREG